jgi:hypothetical protein
MPVPSGECTLFVISSQFLRTSMPSRSLPLSALLSGALGQATALGFGSDGPWPRSDGCLLARIILHGDYTGEAIRTKPKSVAACPETHK